MPFRGHLATNAPPSGVIIDSNAVKCAVIGGFAAVLALVLDANAVEALLTYIAAGGSALAIMPYSRN